MKNIMRCPQVKIKTLEKKEIESEKKLKENTLIIKIERKSIKQEKKESEKIMNTKKQKKELEKCFCHKTGHLQNNCWSKYLELRPGDYRNNKKKMYHSENRSQKNNQGRFDKSRKKSYQQYIYRSQKIKKNKKNWQNVHFQCARISGLIEGQKAEIILDTGTGTSIIGWLYFDSNLKDKVKLINSEEIFSAANTELMTTRGQCKVRIWIGKLKEIVCFNIVKEVGKEIIVRNRELNQWNAKIDLENKQFEMGKDNVVKLRINPENSERVTLIKAIKIPARSAMSIQLRVPKKEKNRMWYLKTSSETRLKRQIYIQDGIIGKREIVTVLLVNKANSPIKL